MNENDELMELLIGKFLDAEISPSEQRILDKRLASDPEARALFDQLTRLHETSQEAVQVHVLEQGNNAVDIFTRAWEQAERKRPLHNLYRIVFSQFTSGLAAGLLIGASLLLWQHHRQIRPMQNPNPELTANNIKPFSERPVFEVAGTSEVSQMISPEVLRAVDWYHFTDKQGNRYVIEGLRENAVQPVIYRSDF